jgi:acyl carrier protein
LISRKLWRAGEAFGDKRGTALGSLAARRASESKDTVLKHLQEIGGFRRDLLTDSARLDSELVMKSIVFVEIQVALEEDLDIEIDPLAVIELNRLDRVVAYLDDLVAAKSPA